MIKSIHSNQLQAVCQVPRVGCSEFGRKNRSNGRRCSESGGGCSQWTRGCSEKKRIQSASTSIRHLGCGCALGGRILCRWLSRGRSVRELRWCAGTWVAHSSLPGVQWPTDLGWI